MVEEPDIIVAEAIKRRLISLEDEIVDGLRTIISSGQYLQAQQVAKLEKCITEQWHAPVAVATSSGTASLQIALMAAGIKPGDEVIVPALTFASTSFAVNAVGAVPVFVDIDQLTLTMDPMAAHRAVTDKTTAIIPVHLYGQPANMHWFQELAKAHNLQLIEDCAQAHGATYDGKAVGTLGDFGCYSFYAGKIIGAMEDAGMVLTRHDGSWNTLLKLRDLGRLPGERYKHHSWGMRARMGEFAATVIQTQLKYLDDWIARRRAVAAKYDKALKSINVQPPFWAEGGGHSYYKYTIIAESHGQRGYIEQALKDAAIQIEEIYPAIVPDQPAYRAGNLPFREEPLKVARNLVHRLTCLPMYPELTDRDIERVVSAVVAGCAAWEERQHRASGTAAG